MSVDARHSIPMQMITASIDAPDIVRQMAELLTAGFKGVAPDAWTTFDDARATVAGSSAKGSPALP
jgi:hypothetical protein